MRNHGRYMLCGDFTLKLSLYPRTPDEDVETLEFRVECLGMRELYRLQPTGSAAVDTEYPSIHEAICAFMEGGGYPIEDVRPITEAEFRAAEDVCMQEFTEIYANDPFDPTGNSGLRHWLGGGEWLWPF
jgi:hypothetical protein